MLAGASLPSVNGGPLAGFRNRIHNGNFAINQRVVAGTVVLAAGAYGHDRWKAGAGGCTFSFATNGIDTTLTITAGSLMQVVEGRDVEGGLYTLLQAGTAQARVGVNGAAPSGAYAAVPIATPGATAGQAITVEFGAGTLSKVQLEPGTVATVFERRPRSTELMLCQRYFAKTYDDATAPGTVTTNGAIGIISPGATVYMTWSFPVPMRGPPTVTAYSYVTGAAGFIHDAGQGVDRAVTVASIGDKNMTFVAPSVAASGVWGQFAASADL